jgi:hypothetical protein
MEFRRVHDGGNPQPAPRTEQLTLLGLVGALMSRSRVANKHTRVTRVFFSSPAMFGLLAIPIAAFAFWVWTWGKGIPYINQEPGLKWRAKARVAARNRTKVLDQSSVAWKAGQKGTAKAVSPV